MEDSDVVPAVRFHKSPVAGSLEVEEQAGSNQMHWDVGLFTFVGDQGVSQIPQESCFKHKAEMVRI
jgi:hypothetical protein